MIAVDEIARAEADNIIGDGNDSAHRVHARHEGKRREHTHRRIVCICDRARYKTGEHLDHCGAGKEFWVGDIVDGKRGSAFVKQGCLHGWLPPLVESRITREERPEPQVMVRAPSTMSRWPFTYSAAGLAR